MASLAVIVGAGASFDCVSDNVSGSAAFRPPLVTQLFEARFEGILHQYPLAEAASPDIRRAVADGSVAIEAFLREQLRDSADPYAKRRYRQIPLYLQDLLHQISQTNGSGFTRHPDNYNALVNATLALDEVVFISLNYDTLLDGRLFAYSPLETMDSYIAADRNWALIKLHGSVNWGRPIEGELEANYGGVSTAWLNDRFDRLPELAFSHEIVLREGEPNQMRLEERRLYYPALSVPLGTADELVCPASHVAFLRDWLQRQARLNLLVIGYSGLDQEVLRFIGEMGSPPTAMLIANGDMKRGGPAAEAINAACGSDRFRESQLFNGGFKYLIESGAMTQFVNGLV